MTEGISMIVLLAPPSEDALCHPVSAVPFAVLYLRAGGGEGIFLPVSQKHTVSPKSQPIPFRASFF